MIAKRKETTKERLPMWKRLNISEVGLRIVLAGIVVSGGFAYLVLTNITATQGLQVKDLSDKLDALTSQRSELQASVDRLQSFQHLDSVTRRMDLVSVKKVDVVGSPTGAVASR